MTLELWGLFVSAFVSATLFPGGSEALLLLLADSGHPAWQLLLVATLGNTLGGMSSWLLGWWIAKGYSPQSAFSDRQQQAVAWVQRHGAPVLLLAWLPIVGDPLCLAAGWLRINWLASALAILFGKGLRYGLLLWLALSL